MRIKLLSPFPQIVPRGNQRKLEEREADKIGRGCPTQGPRRPNGGSTGAAPTSSLFRWVSVRTPVPTLQSPSVSLFTTVPTLSFKRHGLHGWQANPVTQK